MKKLRLKLARWLAPKPYAVLRTDGQSILQDLLTEDVASPVTAEPEPERAGRVVEATTAAPSWRPEQHGGVIVAEPTAVANERKLKGRK